VQIVPVTSCCNHSCCIYDNHFSASTMCSAIELTIIVRTEKDSCRKLRFGGMSSCHQPSELVPNPWSRKLWRRELRNLFVMNSNRPVCIPPKLLRSNTLKCSLTCFPYMLSLLGSNAPRPKTVE